MTNVQLYLAIGLPIVVNAAMLGLLVMYMNAQFTSVNKRIDSVVEDIREIRADIKLLTGKVYELMGEK